MGNGSVGCRGDLVGLVGLARGSIAARASSALESTVHGPHGPRSIQPHAIERLVAGTALHESLEHSFVDLLRIDSRGKVEQVVEVSVFLAVLENPEATLEDIGEHLDIEAVTYFFFFNLRGFCFHCGRSCTLDYIDSRRPKNNH